MLLQSIVYHQMEEKSLNRLTAAILKVCRLKKNRLQQLSAHVYGGGGGFIEDISILGEKNCITVSLIGSTCVVFVGRQCFPFLIQLILVGYPIISGNVVSRS